MHIAIVSYSTFVCYIYFVQVIRENLAGPDFVWFFPGWYKAKWWAAVGGTDCTAEEMKNALEHSLGGLGNGVLTSNLSRVLVSNKVSVYVCLCLIKVVIFCRMCLSS